MSNTFGQDKASAGPAKYSTTRNPGSRHAVKAPEQGNRARIAARTIQVGDIEHFDQGTDRRTLTIVISQQRDRARRCCPIQPRNCHFRPFSTPVESSILGPSP